MACTSRLGNGAFGTVHKRYYNNQLAAIKRVPKIYISESHLEREWSICQNLNHRNVVKILGMPWLEESYYWNFPLEFINGETVETFIFERGKSKITLSLSTKATIITGMSEGLHYLHKKDVVHQDLKPDNIMVEYGTLRAVIIDLGLAKLYQGGYSSATDGGNEAYSAPEIFSGQRRNMCSDVWAMGKIIGEVLLDGRLPTRDLSSATIQYLLREHPYCDPVTNMVDGSSIERAEMAGVIGALRAAGQACSRGSSRQAALALVGAGHSNQALVPNDANALSVLGVRLPAAVPSTGTVHHVQVEAHGGVGYTLAQAEFRDGRFTYGSRTTYTP